MTLTRSQISEILAGCEGLLSGPYVVIQDGHDASIRPENEAGPDIYRELTRVDYTFEYNVEEEDAFSPWVRHIRRFPYHIARLSPEVVRDLCRMALAGMDAGKAVADVVAERIDRAEAKEHGDG